MFLIFVFLITATFVLLRPLEQALRNNILQIRDDLIRQAEEFTGRRLEYGSASPSFLGYLDIRNIRLLRPDDSTFLSVSRLRLSFSLWNILRGRPDIFTSARIDRPLLSLDFEKDADFIRNFSAGDLNNANQTPADFLPGRFQVRIRNGEWELIDGFNLNLHNFNLDGNIRDERIVFNSRWNGRGSMAGGFSAAMTMRANGDFSLRHGQGSGTVNIQSLSGEAFRLQPLAVSFFMQDRKLEIRKVYDSSPLDIAVLWDFDAESLNCVLRGDYFTLRDFVTLTGPLRDYNSLTSIRLSGQARLNILNDQLDYNIDLSGLYESSRTNIFPHINGFPETAFFNISAYGDQERMVFRDLVLDSSSGKIQYNGVLGLKPFAPEGSLSLTNIRFREDFFDRGVYAELAVSSSGNEIAFSGENISSGGVVLSNLSLNIINQGDAHAFQSTGTVSGSGPSGSFSIEGYLDHEPRSIQARTSLDSFSIQDLMDLSSPFTKPSEMPFIPGITRAITERLYITTELFYTTDFVNTMYNAPVLLVAYGEGETFRAEASFMGNNNRFDLDNCLIVWDGNTFVFTAHSVFANPNDISFALEASYRELVYSVNGVLLDRNFLSVRGTYGFEVFFRAGGISGYSGYAQADYVPLPVSEDSHAYLSFLFSLRYDSPLFWTADIDYFEINNIPSPASNDAVLRLTGTADQNAVDINQILYDDGLGLLSGNLAVNWDSRYTNFNITGVMNSEDNERYLLNVISSRDNLEIDLSAERMLLGRINGKLAGGTANGNINLGWSPEESFYTEIFLPSFTFQLSDQTVRGTATASLDSSELSVTNVSLSLGQRLDAFMPFFRVNRREGRLETRAEITGSISGQYLDLSMHGQAEFTETGSWLDYKKIMDSFQGILSVNTARFGSVEAEEPFQFVLASEKDGESHNISINGGPRNMLRLRYSPEKEGGGSIYAALSSPSPVRGSFTGFIGAENIDIFTPDLYADMNSLWRFIPPNDVIAFPGGMVTGSVQITGSLRDPEFFGSARATSLQIQVPKYIPQDIRPVPVNITMNGSEMGFGPVHAQVGNGFGTASGSFIFERWIPFTFNLDIEVAHENTIPAAFEIENIAVRGRASGRLNLTMEDMVFEVNGDITAHNTEITLKPQESSQPSFQTEYTAISFSQAYTGPISIIVNIYIRSGRQVEFLWPNADFPILQAYADLGSVIHITSDVTARQFTINGNVNLRSGEIFYLERNFYLRQGALFFNENETLFEPKISARAEIREQGNEGPVTISMVIDNAPLQSFTPRFESNPPLSQVEIYSILGQNPLGSPSESGNDPLFLLGYTADAITQFTLMRNIQREVRNLFGLDMFSVRTNIFQNMVYMAAGLQSDIYMRNQPSSYFDNTTIFLGKYLAPDIFVESLFTWRYDPLRQEWGGMRLEPEIGLEMRNPLFDVRLNMLLMHPENWFINDITLSLLWRWSF